MEEFGVSQAGPEAGGGERAPVLGRRARDPIPGRLAAGGALAAVSAAALLIAKATLLALMVGLCLVAAGELYRFARTRGVRPVPLVGFASIGGTYALAYARPDALVSYLPSVMAATVVLALAVLLARRRIAGATSGVAVTLAGAVYCGGLGSFVVVMRRAPGGFKIVLVYGLMVVLNRAGAAFGDRWLGTKITRASFAPTVSPQRTWEGFGTGAIATFAVAGVAVWRMNPPFAPGHALVLAGLMSIVAPLGDLAESSLKRDSHAPPASASPAVRGGVLEYLGTVLLTAPVFYFALRALLG